MSAASGRRGDRDLSRRRGFWRLTFVVWLLASAAVVAAMGVLASPSPLTPFEVVGADGSPRPEVPAECASELPTEGRVELSLDAAIDLLKRVRCDAQMARLAEWEATAVPLFRTEAYRASVRRTALVLACETAAIWGVFYLFAWVGAGFRSQA